MAATKFESQMAIFTSLFGFLICSALWLALDGEAIMKAMTILFAAMMLISILKYPHDAEM